MELTQKQNIHVATLLNDIRRIVTKELKSQNRFTGHIVFDVNCTSGGVTNTDVKIVRHESIKK
tara:strand:+ start:305 stop:493 length:189 start_codon:yes stop_codon:yes gene_type:complete